MATCAWSVEAPTWWVPYTPGVCDDRIAEAARAPGRLVLEDVEPRADPLLPRPPAERRLVHHRAARRVDQVRARPHRREELRVHQVLGVRVAGDVDRHRVRQPRHLERRLRVDHAEAVRLLVRQAPRPGRRPACRTPRARAAISRPIWPSPTMPERAPVEPARLGVLALVPASLPEVGHLVGNAPVAGEEQSHHQLGHRDRVLPRTVGDEDAEARRGGHVDRVDAGAGADHERERGARLERVGAHLLAAHDEDVRIGLRGWRRAAPPPSRRAARRRCSRAP